MKKITLIILIWCSFLLFISCMNPKKSVEESKTNYEEPKPVVARANCTDYNDAECIGAKPLSHKKCMISNSRCVDLVRQNCSDFDAAQCLEAKPLNNVLCKLLPNGLCGDMVVSDYYKKETDGSPMIKRNFVMPQAKTGPRPVVHCLERSSPYFDNDDEVNQVFVDLSKIAAKKEHYYHWGVRKWEELRTDNNRPKNKPIFIPLCPTNSVTKNDGIGELCKSNKIFVTHAGLQPLAANGTLSRAYGLGLYAATSWNSAISYAPLDPNEIYLLEVEAPIGTLTLKLDDLDLIQKMHALDLRQADIENCNPPVIYFINDDWLVLKDPTGMKAKESQLEHVKPEPGKTLKQEFKKYPPVVEEYLKTRLGNK